MFRLTLAQMRRSIGRLTAAAVAIVIGTAFITTTLLAGEVMQRGTADSIAAQYADSDLVVSVPGLWITEEEIAPLADVDGVDVVQPLVNGYLDLSRGGKRIVQSAVPTTSDPRLQPLAIAEGAMPGADEIALPQAAAERLGAALGDTVTYLHYEEGPTPDDDWTEVRSELTLVGIVEDPYGAYAMSGGAGIVTPETFSAQDYPAAMVLLDPGTDLETARTALADAAPEDARVVTTDEHARAVTTEMTGGEDVFTSVILVFAAVAMLVAALVIANTFQVLVAQRTRTLALLRAVGANKRQLARSVLAEATILGLVASVVGIVVGTGLAQITLQVLAATDVSVPLPETVPFVLASIVAPLLVGTAVTVLASLAPARAATRVSPLEALRPADAPTLATGAGKVRLVVSTLLALGGAALLALGAFLGTRGDAEIGLLVALAGGAISFVGVLVGAIFWLPRIVSFFGRLAAGTGASARLAAANTLRNPRRTAATSTALLIGVTLVAMMSTGAASARTSLTSELDSRYPVDVSVSTDQFGYPDEHTPAVPLQVVEAVRQVDGVRDVVELTGTTAVLPDEAWVPVYGVEPAEARDVARDPESLEGFAPGTLLVPQRMLSWYDALEDGRPVTLTGPDGAETTLTVRATDFPGDAMLTTPADLRAFAPDAVVTSTWVGLTDVERALEVVWGIQDAVAELDAPVEVAGAAVERAVAQSIVDTVLAILVGLLAVAVVIALIGVANTLSLSVIERRRESATLRAIGLSRRQLRWMLAVEGMLIAGVGALVGVVLGLLYGWAGSITALSVMGDVTLAVPWRDVALVLAVALVAGLVASVVPGRTAARTSPVAALAVD